MSDRPLSIALDARPLTSSRAGVATYCRGLVHGLSEVTGMERIALYAKEPPPDGLQLGDSIRWRAMPGPLWLPLAVPRALMAGRIDVFHGTNHMAPPFAPVPTVVTVHDLTALTMPGYHTWRNRVLTVPQMLLALRRATRLIAVSAATARDLSRLPGVDPARIRVIPEAPAPGIAPATPDAVQELARRLCLPPRFFLFLGALEPRKNVVALVRALALLREQGDVATHLVIAGAEGWDNAEVHRAVRQCGLEEQVRFLGFVAAADLPALYGAALAFVYPSLYEGFGLPPLEAMASGAPVICSNTSSLPEVAGDAALLVDPESVGDLTAALRRVRDDESLRLRLKEAGLERSRLFSWGRAARATLEVYHEVAVESGRVGGRSHARGD